MTPSDFSQADGTMACESDNFSDYKRDDPLELEKFIVRGSDSLDADDIEARMNRDGFLSPFSSNFELNFDPHRVGFDLPSINVGQAGQTKDPNNSDCAGMAAELGRLDGILTTTSSRLNENIAVTGNADLRQSIDQTLADINLGASLIEAGQSTLLAANSAWLRGTPSNASSFLGGSGNAMRGNLFSSGALNGLRVVGTGASVLGAGLEINAAVVAFSNGETAEGFSSTAGAVGGTVGVFIPPIGAATLFGSLVLKPAITYGGGAIVDYRDRHSEGRQLQGQRDLSTFQQALAKQQDLQKQFTAAGCK